MGLGPTCNLVEALGPQSSTYRPDVERASRADRARARELLRGVNKFCRTHSASELMGGWLPGDGNPSRPTHFFNPDGRGALGLDPSSPRAALVYRGEIGGVMFTGTPLPHLGSVPRAHTHGPDGPREMLHVYCTPDLADAFTPSRRLGVLADATALRQKIRPRVARLVDPHLTDILGRVREYAGDDLLPVDRRAIESAETGDPVLRAKREEIRQALPLLTEPQLRAVATMTSSSP